jgi:hypothetical protein
LKRARRLTVGGEAITEMVEIHHDRISGNEGSRIGRANRSGKFDWLAINGAARSNAAANADRIFCGGMQLIATGQIAGHNQVSIGYRKGDGQLGLFGCLPLGWPQSLRHSFIMSVNSVW